MSARERRKKRKVGEVKKAEPVATLIVTREGKKRKVSEMKKVQPATTLIVTREGKKRKVVQVKKEEAELIIALKKIRSTNLENFYFIDKKPNLDNLNILNVAGEKEEENACSSAECQSASRDSSSLRP